MKTRRYFSNVLWTAGEEEAPAAAKRALQESGVRQWNREIGGRCEARGTEEEKIIAATKDGKQSQLAVD
ncbi:hypothetical protein CDAR_40271 [Caerostris darwini]|uniref:Uncharacterized protein n=1 Tax=Caerostris darwini TaxID=1538125 RepID=A0AAV4R9N7_9ARAC|nr:hypothetical protein CDAR_40271 [Caerostris darwini]